MCIRKLRRPLEKQKNATGVAVRSRNREPSKMENRRQYKPRTSTPHEKIREASADLGLAVERRTVSKGWNAASGAEAR